MWMGDIMYKGKAFFSFLFSYIVSMRRLIGLLTVALMAGAFGCGSDSDPMKSDNGDTAGEFAGSPVVGAWVDEDGFVYTFRADGTFYDEGSLEGKWSLNENELTMTYDDPDLIILNERLAVVLLDDTRFEFINSFGNAKVWTKQNS